MTNNDHDLKIPQNHECLVDRHGDHNVSVEHTERTRFPVQFSNDDNCEDLNIFVTTIILTDFSPPMIIK